MTNIKLPHPSNNNIRGALWMLGGVICFSISAIFIKISGYKFHPFQIVFFRCIFGLIVVIPLIAKAGLKALVLQKPVLHFCAFVGMSCGFYAISKLELVTAISLSFTRPLFIGLLAIIFLKEVIGWRRGLATIIGFIGIMIMVKPGLTGSNIAILSGLIAALSVGGALIFVKLIVPYDSPVSIMLTFSIGTAVISILPAIFFWQTPTGQELALLIALGIMASVGQYCTIKAFSLGESTIMGPIDYLQIILGTISGFYLFQEQPNSGTYMGATIIVLSTLYIVLRDSNLPNKTISSVNNLN
jgi:drug/metabolite transporter (DMT)-like permease